MQPKTLFCVIAVVSLIFAIGFLTIPEALLAIYGVDTTPSTVLEIRFYGTLLLGLGLIVWLLRNTSDLVTLRGLLTGLSVSFAVGAGLSAWGTISGVMNEVGWSAAAIYTLLLIGCFLAFPE